MAKTIRKIEKTAVPTIAKKRVAAYARVSVPTERLLHSLDEQISYYSNRDGSITFEFRNGKEIKVEAK